MSTTIKSKVGAIAFAFLLVLFAVLFAVTGHASGTSAATPIFLIRLNGVQSTYPITNAFNVGSSTPQGGAAKLGVSLGASEVFPKAFEVASTTGTGTATTSADILLVKNTGCIQLISTSSATQMFLVPVATTTLGTNGNFVLAAKYGTCP